jgi:hypothetical protein
MFCLAVAPDYLAHLLHLLVCGLAQGMFEETNPNIAKLAWREGYAAFSVSAS